MLAETMDSKLYSGSLRCAAILSCLADAAEFPARGYSSFPILSSRFIFPPRRRKLLSVCDNRYVQVFSEIFVPRNFSDAGNISVSTALHYYFRIPANRAGAILISVC